MEIRFAVLQMRQALRQRAIRLIGVAAIVATAVAISIVAFYWLPIVRDYERTAAMSAEARRQIAAAVDAQALARAFHAAGPEVDRLEAKLNAKGGQAALVQDIAQLAARHRLKVLSETYDAGKPRDGYVPLTLTLSMHGPYAGVRGFLTQLPALPQWISVQEATLDRADDGGIKVQLRLLSYRRMEAGA